MGFNVNTQQGGEGDTGGGGLAYRDCGTFCRAACSASSSCAPMEWWVPPIRRLEPQLAAMVARARRVLAGQVDKGWHNIALLCHPRGIGLPASLLPYAQGLDHLSCFLVGADQLLREDMLPLRFGAQIEQASGPSLGGRLGVPLPRSWDVPPRVVRH